jgi:acyl carrier protein
MMPYSLVYLQALPLTPGGKVNRLALPAPDRSRPQLDTPFQKAQTPVERALAEIWTEVLGLEPIGALDNFFDLGGHSLLATQVVSRVRAAFQVELPLRSLFETPTVADLAVAIVQTQADEETARLLRELDVISDQEAQRRLAQTMQGKES